MHSYLIFAKTPEAQEKSIELLVNKLGVVAHEVKASKIEEVRTLNSFVKLKVDKPTAIIIKTIETATSEALNALLKNIEEPQENLCFILTTKSVYKVLPTITSRCQIVMGTENSQFQISQDVKKFLQMSVSDKLAYISELKGRGEATSFVEQVILYSHLLLRQENPNYSFISELLRKAQATLVSLKANGNVALQLTNFVVNYPD